MRQEFKGLDQSVSASKLKMYAINKILTGIRHKHSVFAVGVQNLMGKELKIMTKMAGSCSFMLALQSA